MIDLIYTPDPGSVHTDFVAHAFVPKGSTINGMEEPDFPRYYLLYLDEDGENLLEANSISEYFKERSVFHKKYLQEELEEAIKTSDEPERLTGVLETINKVAFVYAGAEVLKKSKS